MYIVPIFYSISWQTNKRPPGIGQFILMTSKILTTSACVDNIPALNFIVFLSLKEG